MKRKNNDIMDRATFEAAMRDLAPPEPPSHWVTQQEIRETAGGSPEAIRQKLWRGIRDGVIHPMVRKDQRIRTRVYDPAEVVAWWKIVEGKHD